MKKELISIIIPAYNCRKYIRRCLDSIISQTYENFEIIIVNDGSTDDTELICKEYVKKDKRIKLYTKRNGGCSSARNYGLNKITGKYITWIDSDDSITSDYLEKLYINLMNHNVDISICNYTSINEFNKTSVIHIHDELIQDKQELISKIYRNDTLVYITCWCKLFKSELFVGLKFPEGKCFDDQTVIPKVYLRAKSVYIFDEPNYNYYYISSSWSHTDYKNNLTDIIPVYEERIKLFSEKGYKKLLYLTNVKYMNELIFFVKENIITENLNQVKNKIKAFAKIILFESKYFDRSNLKIKLKCIIILLFYRLYIK